jgi:hypothetical protein
LHIENCRYHARVNPFRRESIGWTAAALCAVGAILVIVNALNIFDAIPLAVGLVLLAIGALLTLAGFFSGPKAAEPATATAAEPGPAPDLGVGADRDRI